MYSLFLFLTFNRQNTFPFFLIFSPNSDNLRLWYFWNILKSWCYSFMIIVGNVISIFSYDHCILSYLNASLFSCSSGNSEIMSSNFNLTASHSSWTMFRLELWLRDCFLLLFLSSLKVDLLKGGILVHLSSDFLSVA